MTHTSIVGNSGQITASGTIMQAIRTHAAIMPAVVAIRSRAAISDTGVVTWQDLLTRVLAFSDWLLQSEVKTLGILLDNTIDWVLADLAAIHLGINVVPIPAYFSPAQIDRLISVSGIDCLLSVDGDAVDSLFAARTTRITHAVSHPDLHNCKITFTSGSTGDPKGVVLEHAKLEAVALSIVSAMESIDVRSHLCILPLASLLENIAGIYAPLIKGIEIILPTGQETGLQGSSSLDVNQFAACLQACQPHSLILVPQLLTALVTLTEFNMLAPDYLRMVAVGGARVGSALLEKSRALGIPIYEGYGLSEAGSVTCLNLPGSQKAGSVGKVLPHAELRISESGEIEVRGSTFSGYLDVSGYLGETGISDEWIATGDTGEIDAEGFVFIKGRIKNTFITSFGRNINPEWVEAELTQHASIAHALFYGEARPTNLAVIWPRFEMDARAISEIVANINKDLPDYAHIHDFVVMTERLPADFMTSNGRIRSALVIDHLLNSVLSSGAIPADIQSPIDSVSLEGALEGNVTPNSAPEPFLKPSLSSGANPPTSIRTKARFPVT